MTTKKQLISQIGLLKLSQRSLMHEIERLKKLSKSRLRRLKAAQGEIEHLKTQAGYP